MISISTPTYDLNGSRIFKNTGQTNLTAISRRVTRTATLDGGCAVYDGGYSASDRTIVLIQENPSDDDKTFCDYIVKYYREVAVCCSAGAFLAVPQSHDINNQGNLILTLLVKEEL